MAAMNMLSRNGYDTNEVKIKRDGSEDIPKPFLRGGEDAVWTGAGTGANTIAVKRIKSESS